MTSSPSDACPYCSSSVSADRASGPCPNCRRLLLPSFRPGTDYFARWFPAEVGRFRLAEAAGASDSPNLFRAEGRDGVAAVIQFLPEYADADPAARFRFDREVGAWQGLNHPNVVRVLDNGTEGRLRYYAQEQVEGDSLTAVLADLRAANKTMPFDYAHHYFKQLCHGLNALHEAGIRHEEINPVLLLATAGHDLKILPPWPQRFDANRADQGRFAALTRPGYYAPEQVDSPGTADARADRYAAGMVMYEMLTGFLPTRVLRRPSVINPSVPTWFEDKLVLLLDKNPEGRPELGSLAEESGPALTEAGLNRLANIVGGALIGAVAGAATLYYNKGNIWLGALAGVLPGLLAGALIGPKSAAPRRPTDSVDEAVRFPAGGPSRANPTSGPQDGITRRG